MMQDVNGKLNPGLLWHEQQSTTKLFSPANGLKFKEETSTMLNLEHSLVWCRNLGILESRSEVPGKF
jgi:hypothetical protein